MVEQGRYKHLISQFPVATRVSIRSKGLRQRFVPLALLVLRTKVLHKAPYQVAFGPLHFASQRPELLS
jgi:hypothetical protein